MAQSPPAALRDDDDEAAAAAGTGDDDDSSRRIIGAGIDAAAAPAPADRPAPERIMALLENCRSAMSPLCSIGGMDAGLDDDDR